MKTYEIKLWKLVAIITIIIISILAGITFVINSPEKKEDIVLSNEKQVNKIPERMSTVEEKTSTVTVQYVDNNGTKLINDETKTNIVGTEYTAEKKNITGYVCYNEPLNQRGKQTEEPIVVTYTYRSLLDQVSTSGANNTITVQVQNQREESEYDIVLINKGVENNVLNGGKYQISSNTEVLVENVSSYNGSALFGTLTIEDEGIKEFLIDETEAIEGYKDIEQIGLKVTKSWDETNKRFKAEAELTSGTNTTVQVDETGARNNIIITVEHKIKERTHTIEIVNTDGASKLSDGEFEVVVGNDTYNLPGENQVSNGVMVVNEITLNEDTLNNNSQMVYTIRQTKAHKGYKKYSGEVKLNVRIVYNDETQKIEALTSIDAVSISNRVLREKTDEKTTVKIPNERVLEEYDVIVKNIGYDGNNIYGGKYSLAKGETEIAKEVEMTESNSKLGKIILSSEGEITYTITEDTKIPGYEALGKNIVIKSNTTWQEANEKFVCEFTSDDDEVTEIKKDQGNKQIIVTINHKKTQEKFEVKLNNTDMLDNLISGGKFVVKSGDTKLIEGQTISGVLNVEEINTKEEVTKEYTIEQSKTAEGYIVKESPVKYKILIKYDAVEQKFKAIATLETETEYAKLLTTGNIITFIIKNEKEEQIEPEIIKNDLTIVEFVTKVDSEVVKNRIPKVTVTSDGKVEIVKTDEAQKVANNQIIEMTIRIYNADGKAEEIPDIISYIPEGLVYLPEEKTNKDFGWKMYNKNNAEVEDNSEMDHLKTSVLTGNILEKYEADKDNYLEIKMVLKANEEKVDETRIAKVKTVLGEDTKDINKDNNETTESVYLKYFDISITKYLSKMEIIENDKNIVKTVDRTIQDKKNSLKQDVLAKRANITTIQLTYNLVIKNEGEIEGNVGEILENIPNNLKIDLDTNPNWIKEGNKVKYTAIADKLLKPGETVEIPVILVWEKNNTEAVNQSNIAEIVNCTNEYNAKDNQDNNKDEELVIISINTGKEVTLASIIVMITLVTTCVIVYFIRKNTITKK